LLIYFFATIVATVTTLPPRLPQHDPNAATGEESLGDLFSARFNCDHVQAAAARLHMCRLHRTTSKTVVLQLLLHTILFIIILYTRLTTLLVYTCTHGSTTQFAAAAETSSRPYRRIILLLLLRRTLPVDRKS